MRAAIPNEVRAPLRRLAAALGFVLLLAFSVSGRAQSASVPATLAGTWRRSVDEDRARSVVLAAFEPRLTAFPEMLRGLARRRIAESVRMAERVEIALGSDHVRVTYFFERPVRVDTPLGGSTRVRDIDGEERRVVQRLRGGWLEQVFTNDDGSIDRLLSTEPDGRTMHLDCTVHNERLGGPIRWRLDYTR